MAFKFKTAETKIILLNLLKCVLIFYSVYYGVLCFCFTAFRLQMLDGFAPFDFKTKPSWINPHYIVLIVSMELAYFISGLLFALVVEEWVWDYAITVTVIHVTVTSAVPCK
ncbi:putative transmembrane protein 244 isoform 1-T1 [Liasis olivaceus]